MPKYVLLLACFLLSLDYSIAQQPIEADIEIIDAPPRDSITKNTPTFLPTTSQEELLANQYYQNKEYDKAIELYEKLYEKNTTTYLYNLLLSSYIEIKEYKKAEKIIQRRIKKQADKPNYQVDLGYLYKIMGQEAEAQTQYEKTSFQVDLRYVLYHRFE